MMYRVLKNVERFHIAEVDGEDAGAVRGDQENRICFELEMLGPYRKFGGWKLILTEETKLPVAVYATALGAINSDNVDGTVAGAAYE